MKKNDYQELIAHLYFAEGLEELRHIGFLKRKYALEWSKTKGEKLCKILLALACGENPKKIMKNLSTLTNEK